jgi:uncharacterized protein (UPF0332 family)
VTAHRTALAAWNNALSRLAEAERLDPATAPHAVIGSAYFAMLHAARAVVILRAGSRPKTHAGVTKLFREAVRDAGDDLLAAAASLKAVENIRNSADYADAYVTTADGARRVAVLARGFVELCATRFGFPPPQDPA